MKKVIIAVFIGLFAVSIGYTQYGTTKFDSGVEVTGALQVDGASTLTGAITTSGDITLGDSRVIVSPNYDSSVATTTLTTSSSYIVVITTANACTVTLPSVASSTGTIVRILATGDLSGSVVTITGNASEEINGSTTYTSIDAQYDTVELWCNGTEWFVLNKVEN